jgi:adenylosuccinate synthase
MLDDKRRAGKRILFEGAQGALLDIDHGTYPFVTSSNTSPARRRRLGARPGGRRLCAGHRQGLYDPRRRRPVPDRAVRRDRRIDRPAGKEFGVVTGRKRRCGWFDACWCARR